MKRVFDFSFALFLLLLSLPVMILTGLLIFILDPGPVLYWSKRVGQNNELFLMPKFRTMKLSTPQVATHLLKDPDQYLIRLGGMIRLFSLDELPQLFSVLTGKMSFVGPRPALFNQDDLISLRTKKQIHTLPVGITGWAQINGRDSISIEKKVEIEEEYLKKRSFLFDLKIIILTAFRVIKPKDVTH